MKILGTGLHGLVGSRIVDLLKDSYQFQNISRRDGVDITNESAVIAAVLESDAEIILHLAGKTDVDGCEKDKSLGKEGEAWKVNVSGTQNIANAAIQSGKKVLYISTDFVFDGQNPPQEGYREGDMPNPINWYGQTKYEGEKIISGLLTPWVIIRVAYPYRASFQKTDFFRAIYQRLRDGENVMAITDHFFCPTFIDDIALGIDTLIQKKAEGIFHMVGGSIHSPYEIAEIIANTFGCNSSRIKKTTREEFFKDRALRPFRLALKNDNIERFGIGMKKFEEGIQAIKKQLQTNNL